MCVRGLCGPSLLSLFRILGSERQPCDSLALVHSILRSLSSSAARIILIPHISLSCSLCLCEGWSHIFIKSQSALTVQQRLHRGLETYMLSFSASNL